MYRVVIADDEVQYRGWLSTLFARHEEFQVVGEASSGAEALQLIETLQPDLVIADLFMPDPDGLEIIRNTKQNYSNIKTILISAHDERIYEELAIEEGALAFIPKVKLSLKTLLQTLQEEK